jgi:malate synthase
MKIVVPVSDFDKIKNVIDSDITIEDLEDATNTENRADLFRQKPELA